MIPACLEVLQPLAGNRYPLLTESVLGGQRQRQEARRAIPGAFDSLGRPLGDAEDEAVRHHRAVFAPD